MREQLLGYLIGALEHEEKRAVESALADSPALRAELAQLRAALAPLEAAEEFFEPPAMLAERTCDVIFENEWLPETSCSNNPDLRSNNPDLADAEAVTELDAFASAWDVEAADAAGEISLANETANAWNSPLGDRPRSTRSNGRSSRFDGFSSVVKHWSLADAVVASGVFVAAALLFFPAIANSRALSQRAICQDNMWSVYLGLDNYANANHRRFPEIPEEGNLAMAGIYAPQLHEGGYVTDERSFLCPGSPLADARYDWRMPTMEEIASARGPALVRYRNTAGGSFAFTLGYTVDGRYYGTRNLGRSFYALLADAPAPGSIELRSQIHGPEGVNVLFEDGSSRFVVWPSEGELPDDPFLNRRGQNAAGDGVNDAVLGGSAVSPLDVRLTTSR